MGHDPFGSISRYNCSFNFMHCKWLFFEVFDGVHTPSFCSIFCFNVMLCFLGGKKKITRKRSKTLVLERGATMFILPSWPLFHLNPSCIKKNMQGNNPLPIYETKTIVRFILGQNTIQYKLDVIGNGLHSMIMHRALTIFTHLRFLMIAPSECWKEATIWSFPALIYSLIPYLLQQIMLRKVWQDWSLR